MGMLSFLLLNAWYLRVLLHFLLCFRQSMETPKHFKCYNRQKVGILLIFSVGFGLFLQSSSSSSEVGTHGLEFSCSYLLLCTFLAHDLIALVSVMLYFEFHMDILLPYNLLYSIL